MVGKLVGVVVAVSDVVAVCVPGPSVVPAATVLVTASSTGQSYAELQSSWLRQYSELAPSQ